MGRADRRAGVGRHRAGSSRQAGQDRAGAPAQQGDGSRHAGAMVYQPRRQAALEAGVQRAGTIPVSTRVTARGLGGMVMKFAAIIEYTQDKAKIAEIRPIHRKYQTGLLEKGQLVAA